MVVVALGEGEMMVCEWSSASRILAMRKVELSYPALRLNELLDGSPELLLYQPRG